MNTELASGKDWERLGHGWTVVMPYVVVDPARPRVGVAVDEHRACISRGQRKGRASGAVRRLVQGCELQYLLMAATPQPMHSMQVAISQHISTGCGVG